MKVKILNSRGEEIKLTNQEAHIANYLQREWNQKFQNVLGYEVEITTLTSIIKQVSEQKFFEVAPADYLPLVVGEGAWSTNLLTYRSFQLADDFATGVIQTGANNARLAQADSGVDALPLVVRNWAKAIGWSIFDLEQAAKSGNWDLVAAKEESRKKNWDLGVQKIAFLGLSGDAQVLGLYNQAGITDNLTLITKKISDMSPSELKTFLAGLLDAYRANNNRTAWPSHFIIPEGDYLGLASPASATFPIRSTLSLLEESLKIMTKNPNFKVLPNAYGDAAHNASYFNKNRYILLNYDPKSIRMNIPVDYTSTLANSIDNFSFQNVGYGQFTGVQAIRPLELMYFSY